MPCLYTACEDLNDVSLVYILCHEEMLKVGRKKAEQRRGNGDEKEKDGEEKIKRIKRDDEGGRGGRRRIGEKRKGEKRGSLKKNKTKKRKESKREKKQQQRKEK